MAETKKELGVRGESIAEEFLIENGYEIVERNWRYGRAEIDIIARHKDMLIVIEVKTRTSKRFTEAAATVTPAQMRRLADAYAHYVHEVDFDGECRFDIIGVHFDALDRPEVQHYKEAFWPG